MIWKEEIKVVDLYGPDYWAIGVKDNTVQFTLLSTPHGYHLKKSFLDGSSMNSIGYFKNIENAKWVARMIDNG